MDAEVVGAEMGTSGPGEIRALVEIGRPDIAVLTTVAESHLEGLGSMQGVLREKLDIFHGLPESGTAIVGDRAELLAEAIPARPDALIVGTSEGPMPEPAPGAAGRRDGLLPFRWSGVEVTLPAPGRHMLRTPSWLWRRPGPWGWTRQSSARGIAAMRPEGMRGEERRIGPATVILDCYNANPQSTRAALDTLAMRAADGPRVAVLGTMLELGRREEGELHDRVLNYALSIGLDRVVATGEFAEALGGTSALIRARNPREGWTRVRIF